MKKMILWMLALCLLMSPAMTAHAEDGQVIYDGNAGKFIFEPGSQYSPTDLFSNFKDVMPGDSLTQRIRIKNDASYGVKVKIYMRALGAHEESVPFLSQMKLRVVPVDSPSSYLFDGHANETAQLTGWTYLGLLYSGGEMDLDVTLNVPVEMDNTFSSQIGYLDWEFKVEEFPIESSDPKPGAGAGTGDTAAPVFWALLGLGAAVVIPVAAWRRRRDITQE